MFIDSQRRRVPAAGHESHCSLRAGQSQLQGASWLVLAERVEVWWDQASANCYHGFPKMVVSQNRNQMYVCIPILYVCISYGLSKSCGGRLVVPSRHCKRNCEPKTYQSLPVTVVHCCFCWNTLAQFKLYLFYSICLIEAPHLTSVIAFVGNSQNLQPEHCLQYSSDVFACCFLNIPLAGLIYIMMIVLQARHSKNLMRNWVTMNTVPTHHHRRFPLSPPFPSETLSILGMNEGYLVEPWYLHCYPHQRSRLVVRDWRAMWSRPGRTWASRIIANTIQVPTRSFTNGCEGESGNSIHVVWLL